MRTDVICDIFRVTLHLIFKIHLYVKVEFLCIYKIFSCKKVNIVFLLSDFQQSPKHLPCLRLSNHCGRGGTKIIKGRRSTFHEMASPRNLRSCLHKASQTWPNMNLRRMIGITMSTWTGHCLRFLTLHEDM